MARTLIQKYGERLAVLIEKGKDECEIEPTVDTVAAVALFIGTVQGLVMQSLLSGDTGSMRDNVPGVCHLSPWYREPLMICRHEFTHLILVIIYCLCWLLVMSPQVRVHWPRCR